MAGVINQLSLWMDDVVRDGPANMAVDEWMLGMVTSPLLRVYRWAANWGSYGYFVPDEEAAESLVGMKRVRRWTGGGIVDHRNDWTYTLTIPRGEGLAEMKGAESYRVIHLGLAEALNGGGVECSVSNESGSTPGGDCFKKAVEFDLLDTSGLKIAGAGQRRTKKGLLHQGSLAIGGDYELARRLGDSLARTVVEVMTTVDHAAVGKLATARYGTKEWRERR